MNIEKRNQAMQWLLETYPKAFKLTDRRPLKLGILEDIQASVVDSMPSLEPLQDAYDYYTLWGSYLQALTEGAVRINLAGEPDGSVSRQEASDAQTILATAAKKLNSRA